MRNFELKTTVLSVAVAALIWPAMASAQAADDAQDAAAEDNTSQGGLDEIVVTARRTAERLQSVPVAVTALSGDALAERSITSIGEVAQTVPNMLSAGSGTGGKDGQFYLRGVGQNDYTANTDPGVAIYIDGVYYARVQGANLELVDLDRIEVLRGPQGTLYGKNATGGLVSYITRSPDAPERTKALIGLSSRNGMRGQFSFNRELSSDDTFYIGGSVVAVREDGFGNSVVNPEDVSDLGLGKGKFFNRRMMTARMSLLYRPADDLTLVLRGDMTEQSGSGQAAVLTGVGEGTVTDQLISDEQRDDILNRDDFYSDYRAPNDLGLRGISLTGTWDGDAVTFKSITAYRTIDQTTGFDFDTTSLPIAQQEQELDQEQFSQEFQLNGSAFGGTLDWITGLYYLREELTQLLTIDGRASPDTIARGGVLFQDIRPVNKSYGAFASFDVHLTDRLSLNAALRYTYEKKSIGRLTELYAGTDFSGGPLATFVDRQDSANWDQFTPKFGINFQATDDILLYATYSNGFRSGGFNIRPAPATADVFDPETVDAYEIGFKSDLLDRTVRLNVAAFQTDYKDVHLLAREGASIFTLNGGTGKIQGVEAELNVNPGGGFKFNGAVGYLDAEVKSALAAAQAVGIRAGNRLPYATKWTLSGGAEYGTWIGENSELTFRVDASYRSSHYFSATNNFYDFNKGYTLVNGRITLRHDDLSLSAFAINMFDKEYFVLRGDNTLSPPTGYGYAVPGEPRRIGVELGIDF